MAGPRRGLYIERASLVPVEQNPNLNVCVCRNKGTRTPLGRGEPPLPAKMLLPLPGSLESRRHRLEEAAPRAPAEHAGLPTPSAPVSHAAVAKQLFSSLNYSHTPRVPTRRRCVAEGYPVDASLALCLHNGPESHQPGDPSCLFPGNAGLDITGI